MRKLIYTSVAALGLFLAMYGTSQAGGIYSLVGSRHHHDGHRHHAHRHQNWHGQYGWQGHQGRVRIHRSPRWHDNSQYDWHPGGWVRHHNHYHYIPGHYDWHPNSRWHY
jgi:hypothetical protein